jgi:hypothetical protein
MQQPQLISPNNTPPTSLEELARRLENPPLVPTAITPYSSLDSYANDRPNYRQRVSDITDVYDPTYLLEPFLLSQAPAGLVGASDSGKSTLARQLAIHIALGLDSFLGMKLKLKHRRAIYLSTEDVREWNSFMFSKQAKALGYKREDLTGLELITGIELDGGLDMLRVVEQSLKEAPADLLIVDTFSEAFLGREQNSNIEVRRTINSYAALGSKYDTVVLFVHHLRKDGVRQAPDQSHILGSQGFGARLRLVLDLRIEEGTSNRFLTVLKGNHLRGDLKQTMSRLALNEDTAIYRDTGERVPREDHAGPQRIRWDKIFGLASELKTAEIVDRVMAEHGVQRRTAEAALDELEKVKHGVYRRKQ